mmetsp:Transcript_39406/g.122220  ORF Transcript_39406/g.122220 Transcript_39406/m.122220 type:complete len:198 (-) Transcript_39406:49-642(-)
MWLDLTALLATCLAAAAATSLAADRPAALAEPSVSLAALAMDDACLAAGDDDHGGCPVRCAIHMLQARVQEKPGAAGTTATATATATLLPPSPPWSSAKLGSAAVSQSAGPPAAGSWLGPLLALAARGRGTGQPGNTGGGTLVLVAIGVVAFLAAGGVVAAFTTSASRGGNAPVAPPALAAPADPRRRSRRPQGACC